MGVHMWICMVCTYLYKSYVQEAQAVVHLLLKVISVLSAFYFDFLSLGLLLPPLSLSVCLSFSLILIKRHKLCRKMRSLLRREKNVPQSGPPLDCACLPLSV